MARGAAVAGKGEGGGPLELGNVFALKKGLLRHAEELFLAALIRVEALRLLLVKGEDYLPSSLVYEVDGELNSIST